MVSEHPTSDSTSLNSPTYHPPQRDKGRLSNILSWAAYIWEFLASFNGSIWIADFWIPQLQRQNYICLMDRVQYFDSSTSGIKRFKTCQIYLCAFFLSDIANVSGRDIPSVFLTGDQYNTSKCTWPHIPRPPPHFWRTWSKLLKKIFSNSVSRSHQLSKHIPLDSHWCLGRFWHLLVAWPTDIYTTRETILFTITIPTISTAIKQPMMATPTSEPTNCITASLGLMY